MLNKEIERIIEKNFDEEVFVLQELISIKSVAEEPTEKSIECGMPFGKGVYEAYKYFLKKGENYGFDAVDVDGYGGHLEFKDTGDEGNSQIFGVAAHLDCVPEGEGWTKNPFAGEIKEGLMYGRGTYDDKGPAVAGLFAMKALKEAGFKPQKRIRLILGLDEETNCDGMKYYLENEEMPDMGFTPDGDFPVIYGEKGILMFEIAKKFGKSMSEGIQLRSISGGEADNMVATNARVVVKSDNQKKYDEISRLAEKQRETGNMDISVRKLGKSLEIKVKGISAHGATPWKGKNAISLMMEFLGNIEFGSDGVNDFIDFYNNHIGYETDGKSLGCFMEDEVSGGTILNVGKIYMDTKSVHLTVNIRYPISFGEDDIYGGMEEVLKKYDLGITKKMNKLPLFVDPESEFIKGLTQVYREVTGDAKTPPKVIGGGTYARSFEDNFVAFGAKFPEGEAVEHQGDEYIALEDLKLMTKIFAGALLKFTS